MKRGDGEEGPIEGAGDHGSMAPPSEHKKLTGVIGREEMRKGKLMFF